MARPIVDQFICVCGAWTPFEGSLPGEGPISVPLTCRCQRRYLLIVHGTKLVDFQRRPDEPEIQEDSDLRRVRQGRERLFCKHTTLAPADGGSTCDACGQFFPGFRPV